MTAVVLESVRATFRAVATTVVPEAHALDARGWATLERAVEHALSARPERLRTQLVTFLRLIEYVPIARVIGRFSHLDAERRALVLRRLERSPLLLVRRGFWGLRTLILLGYYTQPDVQSAIGYRAHPDGWAARRRTEPLESRGTPHITLEVPRLPDESPPA